MRTLCYDQADTGDHRPRACWHAPLGNVRTGVRARPQMRTHPTYILANRCMHVCSRVPTRTHTHACRPAQQRGCPYAHVR
eukprot:1467970-Pleurochrysis_carterae.AAC.1